MLTKIYVDGLRSLDDFSLDLKPGLNVLVGPNGSGKSNILTAFELVSKLNRQGIHNLDSRINSIDVAKLFNIWRSEKKIKIRMEGEVISIINSPITIEYGYEFELKCHSLANEIFFSQQLLELNVKKQIENSAHLLKIEYNEGITEIYADKIYINDELTSEYYNKYYNDSEHQRDKIFKYNSIPNEIWRIFNLSNTVRREIAFDSVYRMGPDYIRYKFEEPTKPVIGYTGSRLLSTLLEISDKKNNLEISDEMKRYPNLNYENVYEKIIEYFKILSPEVSDLSVKNDESKDIIEATVTFENGNVIPLDFMSDGTLKWLSLSTALLTTSGMFLLEEPENFIHPKMQQHFIDLTRSALNSRSNLGILTTHSETILNALELKEFYITYFHDGKTGVEKIKDENNLREILKNTGFELGQYYTTGVLDFYPQNSTS